MNITKKTNTIYLFIMGSYFAANSTYTSFGNLFMINRGFSESEFGLILSFSSLLTLFLQYVSGEALERSGRLNLKNLNQYLILLTLACIFLLFITHSFLITAILYMVTFALMLNFIPLLNSLYVNYSQLGYDITFDVPRSFGSLTFGLTALFLGSFLKGYGSEWMVVITMILLILMFFFVSLLPDEDRAARSKLEGEDVSSESRVSLGKEGLLRFLSWFMLGVAMFYTMHNITSSYMLQIVGAAGGDESHVGVAMAIMALVEIPIVAGYSKLAERFSHEKLLMFSAVGFILRNGILTFATSIAGIYLSQSLQMIAFGLHLVAIVQFTNHILDRKDAVRGQIYISMASTAGGIIGNVVGGLFIENVSVHSALLFGFIATLIGSTSFFLGLRKTRQLKEAETN